jgi:hypothetical protein
MLADDHRRAIGVADGVLEAAERADLAAIVADTLITKGTSLGSLSRATEGLALILGGQSVAESHGLELTLIRAYINRSSVEASRDPRAALRGVQEGLALAGRLGDRSRALVLLSNGVEDALRTGDWPWALAELDTALAEELEASDRIVLLANLISFDTLRGAQTSDLVAETTRLVGASTDPTLLAALHNASAYEAFGTGRFADARGAWHRLAEVSIGNLADATARSARAALWSSDLAAARTDLAIIDGSGLHGAAVEADRATIQAGIAALEGRSADAVGLYRAALRTWRDLGLAWDEALCGLDMALLLDPADAEVAAAAGAAREILVGLGAVPFVERLDTAMSTVSGAVHGADTLV